MKLQLNDGEMSGCEYIVIYLDDVSSAMPIMKRSIRPDVFSTEQLRYIIEYTANTIKSNAAEWQSAQNNDDSTDVFCTAINLLIVSLGPIHVPTKHVTLSGNRGCVEMFNAIDSSKCIHIESLF